jgi:hypothetical protein
MKNKDIRSSYEIQCGEVWGYSTPKKRRNFWPIIYTAVAVIFWALIITLFIWR